jgi:hypothetical protein|tara:strand:+ start:136 stop:351 length:216 start_codon:yes stop_codon:yes gene_type:complete
MDVLENWQEPVTAVGIKQIAAIDILVLGEIVARVIQKMVQRGMTRRETDETLITFVGNLTYSVSSVGCGCL